MPYHVREIAFVYAPTTGTVGLNTSPYMFPFADLFKVVDGLPSVLDRGSIERQSLFGHCPTISSPFQRTRLDQSGLETAASHQIRC